MNIITHPRSFGFEFRNSLLQGTLQNKNGANDIFFFFNGQEYPDSASFNSAIQPNQDETQFINSQINKLINGK